MERLQFVDRHTDKQDNTNKIEPDLKQYVLNYLNILMNSWYTEATITQGLPDQAVALFSNTLICRTESDTVYNI